MQLAAVVNDDHARLHAYILDNNLLLIDCILAPEDLLTYWVKFWVRVNFWRKGLKGTFSLQRISRLWSIGKNLSVLLVLFKNWSEGVLVEAHWHSVNWSPANVIVTRLLLLYAWFPKINLLCWFHRWKHLPIITVLSKWRAYIIVKYQIILSRRRWFGQQLNQQCNLYMWCQISPNMSRATFSYQNRFRCKSMRRISTNEITTTSTTVRKKVGTLLNV